MLIITTLFIVNWNMPHVTWLAYLPLLLMVPTIFAMVHNHNHMSMWKFKAFNILTDIWQIIFYGYPTFVWAPTHNQNHHKYNNKAGDETITYRFSNKNNLFTLLSYPFISGYYQAPLINKHLKKLRKNNPKLFFYCIFQYVLLIGYLGTLFYIDFYKALIYALVPNIFCLLYVLMINYMQHVHTDKDSEFNHSRNFVGLGNTLILNNGLHTAHHQNMSIHWSKLRKEHEKIKNKISPALLEKSLLLYMIRVYILSIVVPPLAFTAYQLTIWC